MAGVDPHRPGEEHSAEARLRVRVGLALAGVATVLALISLLVSFLPKPKLVDEMLVVLLPPVAGGDSAREVRLAPELAGFTEQTLLTLPLPEPGQRALVLGLDFPPGWPEFQASSAAAEVGVLAPVSLEFSRDCPRPGRIWALCGKGWFQQEIRELERTAEGFFDEIERRQPLLQPEQVAATAWNLAALHGARVLLAERGGAERLWVYLPQDLLCPPEGDSADPASLACRKALQQELANTARLLGAGRRTVVLPNR